MAELTERQEAERKTWQYRAIEHCRGNTTQLGAILLSVIGRPAKHSPRYALEGYIDAQGTVHCTLVTRDGEIKVDSVVSTVAVLAGSFNKLADGLQFADAEREELFANIRKWAGKDLRARTPQ